MGIVNYKSKGEFEVRLEARLKNSALIEARESLGLTIKEVSNSIGISASTYDRCELMRYYPSEKTQKKICNLYRKRGVFLYEEDVFPEELKNLNTKGKYIAKKRIPVENLVSLSAIDERYLPSANENIEETVSKNYLEKSISEVLSTDRFSSRERYIIINNFGLQGTDPKSCRELGRIFKLSSGRIHQIKSAAIRKLRRPSLSRDY